MRDAQPPGQPIRYIALKIALIYLLVAGGLLVYDDLALMSGSRATPERALHIVPIEGISLLLTAALLLVLVRHYLQALRRSEQALRESDHLLRQVIDSNPNFVLVRDEHGVIVLVNKAYADSYGISPEQITGMSHWDLQTETGQDLARFEQKLTEDRQVIATGKPLINPECAVARPWGTQWYRITKLPLSLADGTRCVQVIFEDITARKQAEQQLEYERGFLSSAIDILPLPIIVAFSESGRIHANRAAYDFFDSARPQDWWDIPVLDPATRTPWPKEDWPGSRALRGDLVESCEVIIAFPDGREVPVLIHAGPIRAGDGTMLASVVAIQDVTQLKAADRAKDEFLTILSHELLTPLTSILGWSQVALDLNNPMTMVQALTVVHRNAQRQKRLVDDLLDMSRIMHGKLSSVPELTDLWQLAQQGVESSQHAADKRGVMLTLGAFTGEMPVFVDPGRVMQAIGNLLNNALKFTPNGGEVTVDGRLQDGYAQLCIRDTGCGIPSEALDYIFAPFLQAERNEATGGLGLGLALVKGIAAMFDGHVTAASAGVDQGSTFTLEFPLAAVPALR